MPQQVEPQNEYAFSNGLYDGLKAMSQYIIPLETLVVFAIAIIVDLDAIDWLLGFLIAFNVVLGIVLGFAKRSYDRSEAKYVGTMHVVLGTHGGKIFSLELNVDPDDLDTHEEVTFKVQPG